MYGKIFELMYDGSLYGQWEAIVTFQQMIVLADQEGFVDITPQALSARTSIPLKILKKGIEALESEDPYTRTAGEDGKRIVRIEESRPWGWQIVNYQKYRDMASQEDRRKYMREYMRDRRKQEKQPCKHDVNNSKLELTKLTHTDTDTDTDVNTDKEKDKDIVDSLPHQLSKLLFELILKRNPKHKKPNFDLWSKVVDLMIRIDNRDPLEIEKVIKWCQEDEFWQNNILSTTKLRKQFDQLFLKMKKTEKEYKPKRVSDKHMKGIIATQSWLEKKKRGEK